MRSLANFMFCSYSTRKLSMHSQPASSLVFLQTYIGFVKWGWNSEYCCIFLYEKGVRRAFVRTVLRNAICLTSLGDLVTKVFDNSLFDWYYRAKLVNCLCNFVLLRPQLAQLVIDKLFMLLRDPDYRVRLCLARRIGVLFQTWDGHFELFQDVCFYYICCCFYRSLPKRTSQCCAWQLSKETCYTNRTKFLEELMGPILFNWVACGVSLVALVEARGIFASNLEPMNFIKYCCPWLLPALILQEDANSLKWVAKVACQPCAALVKSHFVHIFSVCMAMHCSKKAGWERGSRVLETSILLIVHISEHERDELINKKELVAFPDFDIFNEIQDLHQKIRQTYSPRVHLLNFVKRPHYVPPRLLLCSLDNTNDLSAMVSDFISKIGIGDPHCVVFHLPGDYSVPVFGIAIGMQRLTSMQIRASRKKLFESYEASKEVSDG
ncbi:serine/threonine-protein kinase ATM-like isoform X5 [Primulina tabacum]|uniref:serine/threonine-protein kinase ATM-like isoform X5 n=1 Tax=Primulina tabacum TaxID=48773 RepID=UPI003F5A3C53